GSVIEPTHVLEGNVLALYGDLREQASPRAVMEIRVFLIVHAPAQPEIVFTRDYQVSHNVEARTPEALVAAFNRCLEQILNDLEEDVRRML
ncbi:MAG: hypothetical protein ACYTAS_18800, partial [Planctomycetota bacterium]